MGGGKVAQVLVLREKVTILFVHVVGESWGHACTIRVVLFWNNQERYATLYKSPSRRETTVPYQITVSH